MSYKSSGVDTSAADNWVEGIQKKLGAQQLLSGVGDYAAVYEMNKEELLATSCDGIGTKILWSLDGHGSAKALAQDLIAMNVNDVLCTGATPKLFLDYLACSGKEVLVEGSFLKNFIHGLIEVCAEHGQILAGGETAQMPDLYKGDNFDAAGFSVGFLKKNEFIRFSNLKPGMPVYGWKSAGPHSNGFSWLRKIFDTSKDAAFITEHLMAPTEIYISRFLQARSLIESTLESKKDNSLVAAYHITGSGLLNLLRSQSSVGFDLNLWPMELPIWIQEIQKRTKASATELFSTFNCGFGFLFATEKVLSAEQVESLGLTELGKTTNTFEVNIPNFDVTLS
ncbi:MAG: AIR synthase related protein [Bdellovibrionota bacterium]